MKKSIVTALFTTVLASPAFALHETNCSNATGSLRRTEQEIWGANPVDYTFLGQDNQEMKISERDAVATFDEDTKIVLESKQSGRPVVNSVETYAIRLTLSRKDGKPLYVQVDGDYGSSVVTSVSDYVICHSYENNARD